MLLSNYSIKFRTAVFVAIFCIIAVGSTMYNSMPREGTPDITIPFVFASVYYEGTAPSEMEKLVAIPLEKSLNDLENVKEIRSTCAESLCSVTIEFLAGQDIDMARQRVKDKVDLAKPDLPEDLDEPTVYAFNFSSDFPIFIFALSGNTEVERMKNIAEALQDEIELIPGVKAAEISGVKEREIRVEVDLTRLIAYDVPLSSVMSRISQENSTVSAGNLEMKGDKFQVRVPGEFQQVSEIKRILIDERNGQPVYLEDVAKITDTYKDLSSISRLNGEKSVSINIKKRSGENAVDLIKEVKRQIAGFTFPPEIKTTTVMDESEYVEMMISELENNIASGFLLVIIVLFLFMGGRNSFFVAVAIPLSMLTAFIAMGVMGFTLNMMVLFSLVLAVGMLVDNAIVIVENIYRNRTLGLSRIEAAKRGASEVAWPVITSTITTLAAFSPLLFWPDIMGQFMSFMPKTLIVVLTSSLFVAIIINPAVCSAFISVPKQKHVVKKKEPHPFMRWYERTLRSALSNRLLVMTVVFLFMFLTSQVFARFNKGIELFAETDPRNAIVSVKHPQGTAIERTSDTLVMIEEKIAQGIENGKFEDIRFYLSVLGSSGGEGAMIFGGASGAHIGSMHIEFKDAADRKGSTTELVDSIREEIGTVPGVEIKVEKEKMGPPTGAPVTIEISGDSFEMLSRFSARIIQEIATVPGLVDLQDDYEAALPELQFKVDRHRAALLGLDTDTIGLFLRTSIYGIESSKFRADEDEYDITLRLPESRRETVDLLDEIYIPVRGGRSVPLSSVGTMVYAGGKGVINRKDQKRMISVTGSNQGRTVDEILKEIKPRVEQLELPRGYKINYAGDDEEMKSAMSFLIKAFAVANLLIAVVLVMQFNSVVLPFIIIATVILSFFGVQWGLVLCSMRFSVVMTMLGVISLAGIVVNNAIVLMDCILRRRDEGLDAVEAAVAAGLMRLRPVLLTAVTTILGLIPMAIGWSLEIHEWPPRFIAGAETSAWWAPMAVAVIFGLTLATVLTLVVVPVMYSLYDTSKTALFHKINLED